MKLTETEKRVIKLVSSLSDTPEYQVKEVMFAFLKVFVMDTVRIVDIDNDHLLNIPCIGDFKIDMKGKTVHLFSLSPILSQILGDIAEENVTLLEKHLKIDLKRLIGENLGIEEKEKEQEEVEEELMLERMQAV